MASLSRAISDPAGPSLIDPESAALMQESAEKDYLEDPRRFTPEGAIDLAHECFAGRRAPASMVTQLYESKGLPTSGLLGLIVHGMEPLPAGSSERRLRSVTYAVVPAVSFQLDRYTALADWYGTHDFAMADGAESGWTDFFRIVTNNWSGREQLPPRFAGFVEAVTSDVIVRAGNAGACCKESKETLLHKAADLLGGEQSVRILLDAGADPNAVSEHLGTPLTVALESPLATTNVLVMLYERGASFEKAIETGKEGFFERHLRSGRKSVTEFLDYLRDRNASALLEDISGRGQSSSTRRGPRL